MSMSPLSALVGRLRRVVQPAEAGGLSDAELLSRWAAGRDEAAFELLLWRHGPLVLSVCRRLLRHTQDVEDAFQATFLVLIRKATSIRGGQAVASWLHTVATRIALHARASQKPGEPLPEEMPARPFAPRVAGDELAVLDEEVGRLPEKYRSVFVLCQLQGKTNEEAARELGRPVGTILSRLARARQRLRQRLTQRGVGPAALAPVAVTVPPGLVGTTVKAATAFAAGPAASGAVAPAVVALTEGVLQAMLIAKMKAASAALAVVLLCTGGGLVGYRTLDAHASGPATARSVTAVPRAAAVLGDDTRAERDELRRKLAEALAQIEKLEQMVRQLRAVRGDIGIAVDTMASGRERYPWPLDLLVGPMSDRKRVPPGQADRRLDELKLLQMKVYAADADLRAAKASRDEARRSLDNAMSLRKRAPGAISEEEVGLKKVQLDRAEADVKLKEAQLEEARLFLARTQRLAQGSATPPARHMAPLERRLEEVERALQQLQRAVDAIRHELKAGKLAK
jgi:RNA polymerase sigma factor (sigma-70 family)